MVVIYYNFLSQPSRVLLMFCEINGIPYTRKVVDLGKAEQKTEEYKKINPAQKVPAISDGDFNLSESVAILIYLCTKYQVADHWYPSDVKKRARVDEYLAWHHSNTRPSCGRLFFHEVILPIRTKQPVNNKEVETALMQLGDVHEKLESMFLKEKSFLCGEEISIADLMAVCELMQARAAGHDVTNDHPKLKAWMERVRNRMNPYFDEVHTTLYKVQEKHLKRKASAKL